MAESMKLFQFFQKIHRILGIYQEYPYTKVIVVTSWLLNMVAAIAFLVFSAKSMFDYGFGFYSVIILINGTATHSIYAWQSENTAEFIENWEGFIAKRVNSTAAYKDLLRKIEIFHKLLMVALHSNIAVIFVSIAYFTTIKDTYFLFYPCWYPFNWETPFGYLVAWTLQSFGAFSVTLLFIQLFNFILGSSWFFYFAVEDITQDVTEFNSVVMTTTTTTIDEHHTELTKHFCDIVEIYSDVKCCITEFNEINEFTLFSNFSWILFGLAAALATLQFQLWDENSNAFETGHMYIVLFWTTLYLFILCEPGARLIEQFEVFADEYSQCNWYTLPIKLQRMYMIFLLETQNPIKLTSFADITCERGTLKTVGNGAFSYFMTFRSFEA